MKEFLKKMFSGESDTSSKRVNGTIGFVVYILLTIFVVTFDIIKDLNLETGIKLEESSVTLLITLLYVSAALLGLGILDRIKKL